MGDSLLEKFIAEGRELIEAAGSGILQLERDPANTELVGTVFRAMHTMKGSSGLFDFAPMTRVLHAAEDLLHRVRDGSLVLRPEAADVLLEALDVLGGWLGAIERDERLPADATAVGGALAVEIRAFLPATADGPAPAAGPAPLALAKLDVSFDVPVDLRGRELVAFEYVPSPKCFYKGEDPLFHVSRTPGLADLKIIAPSPFPTLASLDAYQSQLRFQGVSSASSAELTDHFKYVLDEVRFARWQAPGDGGPEARLSLGLVEEQAALLQHACDADQRGARLAAAIVTARNALVAGGLADATTLGELDALAQGADESRVTEGLRAIVKRLQAAPVAAPSASATAPAPTDRSVRRAPTEDAGHLPQTFKVDQKKLDHLLELSGELLVARNAIPYLARQADTVHHCPALARELKEHGQVFNRLADSFHSAVMQLRVIPVQHVFDRFPRLVRDLARRLEKRIQLVVEGESTEADKSVVEQLSDPLIHLVRNAADHGLETPAEREAAGKPPEGTVRLSASQERGQMLIRVSDDGRGIDPVRVKAKAIERGLITEADAAAMTEDEAFRLVMLPGFSTRDAVSDLSGRGVGLDVVRIGVERCGGSVAIESELGAGTTFTLTLPLTMAVTRILHVGAQGLTFGLPFDMVVETVRVPRASLQKIRGREATSLRGRLVPVYRLAELLGLRPQPGAKTGPEESVAMLVAKVKGEEVGLVVDSFHEVVDVILRPLEGVLAQLDGYLGVSLSGDGRALLVLNLAELV